MMPEHNREVIQVDANMLEAMAQLAGYSGDRLGIMEKIKAPNDEARRVKLFKGYFEAIGFIKENVGFGNQDVINAVREGKLNDGEVMLALTNPELISEQDPSKRFQLFVDTFFKPVDQK
ncbi:hypothetical protein KBD75_01040 [Candidatus Woesebacteria bacterium]|nr:hypothetical protein [Candidatus Woesebacteria bacterium]